MIKYHPQVLCPICETQEQFLVYRPCFYHFQYRNINIYQYYNHIIFRCGWMWCCWCKHRQRLSWKRDLQQHDWFLCMCLWWWVEWRWFQLFRYVMNWYRVYLLVPNKYLSPLITSWQSLTKTWSNLLFKKCNPLPSNDFYLYLAVKINSHVQKLILNPVSPP